MSRIFANISVFWAYLSTIFIGIVFLGFSIFLLAQPKVEYLSTTGTIAEIREEYSGSEDIDHCVYVDYEVGGKKYEHAQFGSYSSSMKVGDSVTVLFNPENPEEIQAEGFEIIPYVVGGAGIVAILAGGFLLFRKICFGT